ncbi:hypothetical protein [Jiangella alkaliphila]|uniref:Uncharacterized protein n=1 Tax=Jiangella alkaliphila TaxID=419479 RepID=A0A1H2IEA0_9ACTN|nr:hypothetical protein [Jiangella alkaliphila]SDU42188.1 hypothetical protein SAMN04488563_1632 [Jiangella alkaliphila]
MINTVLTIVFTAFFAGCSVMLAAGPYYKAKRQQRMWLHSHERGDR